MVKDPTQNQLVLPTQNYIRVFIVGFRAIFLRYPSLYPALYEALFNFPSRVGRVGIITSHAAVTFYGRTYIMFQHHCKLWQRLQLRLYVVCLNL